MESAKIAQHSILWDGENIFNQLKKIYDCYGDRNNEGRADRRKTNSHKLNIIIERRIVQNREHYTRIRLSVLVHSSQYSGNYVQDSINCTAQ